MNSLAHHSYKPSTTTISTSFLQGFQKDSNRYSGEFAYVFNDASGDYTTIEHTQATETSVTYNSSELAKAFQQINTSSTDISARQWHRHPNSVNGIQQWENRYLLSEADRKSMEHRFNTSPIKQDIFETLAIDVGNWETHAITYTYDGNKFTISGSNFNGVNTSAAKPVLRIQNGIASAFKPE